MAKKRKKKKKKKPADSIIDPKEIISNLRRSFHKPTSAHKTKKEYSRQREKQIPKDD